MELILQEKDNPRDYLLALNDIGKPKVVDMSKIESGVMNTAILCIVRLIVMNPGTDMDRPTMGIGIVKNYRFSEIGEIATLQGNIQTQIETYLPEFLPISVVCNPVQEQTSEKTIIKVEINITIDGVVYQLLYNIDSSSIEVLQ